MKKIYIILLILMFTFQNCDSWLEVKPTDRQTEEMLFSTRSGIFSAINGVYTSLGSNDLYGKNLSFEFIELLGQRYSATSNNNYYVNVSNHAFTEEKVVTVIDRIWEKSYHTILNINKVIQNIENRDELLSKEEQRILKGEMIGLRAFIHFDLYRLFAPNYLEDDKTPRIPYNLSNSVEVHDRLTSKDFFQNYLLKDIETAEELLEQDIVKVKGPNYADNEKEVVNIANYRQLRFNLFALQALKARVYLWMGDKVQALSVAKNTYENATLLFPPVDPTKLLENNINPDRVFSTEVLFGLFNNQRDLLFESYFDNEKAGNNLLQPRALFIGQELFKNLIGDYRLKSQWGYTASLTNKEYVSIKYKKINQNKDVFYANFIPLIRLSEMLLIEAECETSLSLRYAALNKLRIIRGNPEIEEGTESALNDEIISEYLREYYSEGQSFYLFKRLKTNINKMFNGNQTGTNYNFKKGPFLPMPLSELQSR